MKTAVMDAFFQNLQVGGSSGDRKPRCNCGLVAMELKSPKNNNRMFWRCSKQVPCDFFKWDDELDPNHQTGIWSSSRPQQSGNSSFQSEMTCFKCHKKGHFANACTSSGSATNGAVRGTSSRSKAKTPSKRGASSKSGITAVRVSKKSRPIQ
ncbi:hypothetical protein EDD11_007201 [Mortierella claussenii]|nr:hypothetical protein EDD11_007201 [Mortierella claussenii]